MANLCPMLAVHNIPLEALFWALVDIDDIKYAKYTTDWVSCYLEELGVDTDDLWSAFQANSFETFQQQMLDAPENLQLIVAPIKNLAYRQDLGNQMHQDERHVFLIHKNQHLVLEDWALGVTEDNYPATPLHNHHFIFPFTYWAFDSMIFVNRLRSIDIQKQTIAYANRLICRRAQIQDLKHQLLIDTVKNNDLKKLTCTNLYEESYYYRAFFLSQQPVDTDISLYHEQFKLALSTFKRLFLRMQICSVSREMQQLQSKAIEQINQLRKLDNRFYHAFAKHTHA
jgi:hypothetical protein